MSDNSVPANSPVTPRVTVVFDGAVQDVPLFDRVSVDAFKCLEPLLFCSRCESEAFRIYWIPASGVFLFVCSICEGRCFAIRPAGEA